jgi:hypothetical protein
MSEWMESNMKFRRIISSLAIITGLAFLPMPLKAQALNGLGATSGTPANTISTLPDLTYPRPTESTKIRNYLLDAFGLYPILAGAFAAGISQVTNTPPEWNQGTSGYGKRFGSALGIAAVRTTTRYGLSEAFKEDALYYRCECRGVFPRLSHAVISTLTARRGEDGHRVFSFPALVAPYAGTMTAVYAWYPDRYGPKDAFRMGNYSMLGYIGQNIALEFFFTGSHTWRNRMHLNNGHGSPDQGPNP